MTQTGDSTPLRLERDTDGVMTLTLDREKSANAIDLSMARALADVARACESDKSLRAVVLTGAGKRFCAGGDVSTFATAGDALPAHLRELTMHLHAALASFANMDAPLITAINGAAAGAGLGLAMAGDLCIASRAATFRSAYTAIGLSPDAGTTWWLSRYIGLRRAQQLVLTNTTLDATRALEWGLVTEVVDEGAELARSQQLARELSSLAIGALGASKRLLNNASSTTHTSQLDAEACSISTLASQDETRSAIRAFVERPRR